MLLSSRVNGGDHARVRWAEVDIMRVDFFGLLSVCKEYQWIEVMSSKGIIWSAHVAICGEMAKKDSV